MSVVDFILGRKLASNEQEQRKIGLLEGLPALGLDGLSSSAYGPEAALTVLAIAGSAGLRYIEPITGAILALLGMLYLSYRQTIAAYPVNGGSYTVAKENLGVIPGLLAAAALMIDYMLNVAVGISAGVAALVSAIPWLHPYTLPLCLTTLGLVTLVNLRGTKEAGLAFALPTYLFLASLGTVLVWGVIKVVSSGGSPEPLAPVPALPVAVEPISLWLLLRAFASGCTAMTGVEAVSNGVSAFRDPPVKYAHRTLTAIVAALAILLGGIAYLSHSYGIAAMDQSVPGYQSVLSQLTGAVVGRNWFYYVTLASVLAVLSLSANTSFVDFPRLCRLLAADDFLPRSFALSGRRLVYTVGILFLSAAAALLLVAFRGVTDRLIPLFAVGAFLAFTLSQTGMVVHWRRQMRRPSTERADGPRAGRFVYLPLTINAAGATATGVALAIILIAKFAEGAWLTVLALPALLAVFVRIHRHYQLIERQLATHLPLDLRHGQPPVALLLFQRWDKMASKTLRFVMWLSSDVVAIHISNLNGEAAEQESEIIRRQWSEEVDAPAREAGVPVPRLVIIQSKYRDMLHPLLQEIDKLKQSYPGRPIAVAIPQLIERHWWWQLLLHTRRAAHLRTALMNRGDRHVVVITVPWHAKD